MLATGWFDGAAKPAAPMKGMNFSKPNAKARLAIKKAWRRRIEIAYPRGDKGALYLLQNRWLKA
jgi:hypothetical protein